MTKLDRLIAETRDERRLHSYARRYIEAAAAAIREKALLEARAAVVGSVEPGYRLKVSPMRFR